MEGHYGAVPLGYSLGKAATPSFGAFRPIDIEARGARGTSRRHLSAQGLLECTLLPVAIFSAVSWAATFDCHYSHPEIFHLLLSLSFLIPTVLALRGYQISKLRRKGQTNLDPIWLYFMAGTCLIAWVSGLGLGWINFEFNLKPYYDRESLSEVRGVDPTAAVGQAFLDAATFHFRPGTHVDESKTIGFKNEHVYCVAPIVLGNESGPVAGAGAPPVVFDFWAAGVDCCNPFGGSFWCGVDVHNPEALSGVLMMDAERRGFFEHAVQQAAEEYKILSVHPIFLHWTADPGAGQREYRENGVVFFGACIAVFIFVELALVGVLASARKLVF